MAETRLPKPKVGDPIVFRAMGGETERVINPCSGKHRRLWLSGYIVLSCSKCFDTLRYLNPEDEPAPVPEGTHQ